MPSARGFVLLHRVALHGLGLFGFAFLAQLVHLIAHGLGLLAGLEYADFVTVGAVSESVPRWALRDLHDSP